MNLEKLPVRKMKDKYLVVIPKNLYESTGVCNIPEFEINLEISMDNNQDYYINITGEGNLVINDAITLEEVNYPFSLDISEKIDENNEMIARFLLNYQNSLDIIGLLWENIVLEIPISYSTHELSNEMHDGWRLVGEKVDEIDSRMAPLLELYGEEKE